MFQNLRPGHTIYILEKGEDGLIPKTGQVLNVGNPTPVYNTQTTGVGIGFQSKFEISIRAKVDGTEGDFSHLPAEQNVHDYGTMIVSDSREAVLSEADALKQASQQVIDSVPHHEKIVASCEEVFKVFNPNYAKERERDEALRELSSRLDNFEEKVGKTLGNIEKLLSKGTK